MLISSVRRRKKLFQPSLVRIIVTYLPVNSLSATYKISSLKYSFIILSDIIHILTTFKNYFYIPIINVKKLQDEYIQKKQVYFWRLWGFQHTHISCRSLDLVCCQFNPHQLRTSNY